MIGLNLRNVFAIFCVCFCEINSQHFIFQPREVKHKVEDTDVRKAPTHLNKAEAFQNHGSPFIGDFQYYSGKNKHVQVPIFKVESKYTTRFSYEEFISQDKAYIEKEDEKENPNEDQVLSYQYTQKNEACIRTVSNEIGVLFEKGVDVSRTIFPVCCKAGTNPSKKSTMRVSSKTTVRPTCRSTHKATLRHRKQTTFPETSVQHHHHCSSESVVNIVVHVKCDHSGVGAGVEQQKQTQGCERDSQWNNNIADQSRKSMCMESHSTSSTPKTTLGKLPKGIVPKPHDRLCEQCDKRAMPRPLLPHDISIVCTRPTPKPTTVGMPVFLCLTHGVCKSTTKKPSGRFTLPVFLKLVRSKLHSTYETTHKSSTETMRAKCEEENDIEVLTNDDTEDNHEVSKTSPVCEPEIEDFTEELSTLERPECQEPDLDQVTEVTPFEEEKSITDSEFEQTMHCDSTFSGKTASKKLVGNKKTSIAKDGFVTDWECIQINTTGEKTSVPELRTYTVKYITEPSFVEKGVTGTFREIQTEKITPTEKEIKTTIANLKTVTPSVEEDTLTSTVSTTPLQYKQEDHSSTDAVISKYITTTSPASEMITVSSLNTFPEPVENNTLSSIPENEIDTTTQLHLYSYPDSTSMHLTEGEIDMSTTSSGRKTTESPQLFSAETERVSAETEYQTSGNTIKIITVSLIEILPTLPLESGIYRVYVNDEIEEIIDINNDGYLFYSPYSWFTTDKTNIWSFDEDMTQELNETFFEISNDYAKKENITEEKEILTNILHRNTTSSRSTEQIPFQMFAQSVLIVINKSDNTQIPLKWANLNFNLIDLIAMLRLSGLDDHLEGKEENHQWGLISWENVYHILKESTEISLGDRNEYKLANGSVLDVYKNGSSVWNGKSTSPTKLQSEVQILNRKLNFSNKMLKTPYKSNSELFSIFITNIFQRETDFHIKHSKYSWEDLDFNFVEMLALLRIIGITSNSFNTLELNLNNQRLLEVLRQLRNSKKQYFIDRTVYKIQEGSEIKLLIVFTNSTTDYNNQIVTLKGLVEKLHNLPDSVEMSTQQYQNTNNLTAHVIEAHATGCATLKGVAESVEEIIGLHDGNFLFYCENKWFFTNKFHMWSFGDDMTQEMNETLFKAARKNVALQNTEIKNEKTVLKDILSNSITTYRELEQLPFEEFTQIFLQNYDFYGSKITLKWGGLHLSQFDVIAMIRMSDLESYLKYNDEGHKWGLVSWENVYYKLNQSNKINLGDQFQYKLPEGDSLIVFNNGTSIWQDKTTDASALSLVIERLNLNIDLSNQIIKTTYISNADTFSLFLKYIFHHQIDSNLRYSSYSWKNYNFKWEEVLALVRIINTTSNSERMEYDYSNNNLDRVFRDFRNSEKQYFSDRTVYSVEIGSEIKQLTVFTNDTTDFIGQTINLRNIVQLVYQLQETSSRHTFLLNHEATAHGTLFSKAVTITSPSVSTHEIHFDETKMQTITLVSSTVLRDTGVFYRPNFEEVEEIIEDDDNILFYSKHQWYLTNTTHIWSFNDDITPEMNETFLRMAREGFDRKDVEKTKERVNHILSSRNTKFTGTEQIPFQEFAQSVLKIIDYNETNIPFIWEGLHLKLPDVIAMLRFSGIDSYLTADNGGYTWGLVSWENVYNILKESNETVSEGTHEYNIPGGISLIVYNNYSSSWQGKNIGFKDLYSNIKVLNNNLEFSDELLKSSYESNEESFSEFIKSVLHQQKDLHVKYESYYYENKKMKWDEILALLRMIDITEADIKRLEHDLDTRNLDMYLNQLQSSSKHFYIDRTVYEVPTSSGIVPLTVYTNGTTEYNKQSVELGNIFNNTSQIPEAEKSSSKIRHIIDLGGGVYQFYAEGKWFITDQKFIWCFEDETNVNMNETFFSIPEDKFISGSVRQFLDLNWRPHDVYKEYIMPYELFAQSILKLSSLSKETSYKWHGHDLQYSDIVAMLRLSGFTEPQAVTEWGQTNWQALYERVKSAPKTVDKGKHVYELVDFDGIVYSLIIFSNGTSIWRNERQEFTSSIYAIEKLNSRTEFSESVLISPYMAMEDSFEMFMQHSLHNKVKNNVTYTNYIWDNKKFTWEEFEAINRLLIYHYKSKQEVSLSLDLVVWSVMNAPREIHPHSLVFKVIISNQIKPLTIYENGTSVFDDITLGPAEALKELETRTGYLFIPENNEESSLKPLSEVSLEVGPLTIEKRDQNSENKSHNINFEGYRKQFHQVKEVLVVHKYDWKMIGHNPTFTVYYPIYLGGEKVQFYMNNMWYITDGLHCWPFFRPYTKANIEVLNHLVTQMNQSFIDDPTLFPSVLQNLVNSEYTNSAATVVMPIQILALHILFFKKNMGAKYFDTWYEHGEIFIRTPVVLAMLRCSTFNNFTTQEADFIWAHGEKINWEWIVHLVLSVPIIMVHGTAMLFDFGQIQPNQYTWNAFNIFQNTPPLIIYPDGSSDWGSQHMSLDETVTKLQDANKNYEFSLAEIAWILEMPIYGQYPSLYEFKSYYNTALRFRLEQRTVYKRYKVYLAYEVSWIEFLAAIRCQDAREITSSAEWEAIFASFDNKSYIKNFLDRIEFDIIVVNTGDIHVTVYMNESSVYNGVKKDIDEYKYFDL